MQMMFGQAQLSESEMSPGAAIQQSSDRLLICNSLGIANWASAFLANKSNAHHRLPGVAAIEAFRRRAERPIEDQRRTRSVGVLSGFQQVGNGCLRGRIGTFDERTACFVKRAGIAQRHVDFVEAEGFVNRDLDRMRLAWRAFSESYQRAKPEFDLHCADDRGHRRCAGEDSVVG